jgi:hypothetical protein
MISIELPKQYDRKMRDQISAGASNINLQEYSHFYFNVGMALAIETENADLRYTLTKAFSGDRFEALMVHALSRYFKFS